MTVEKLEKAKELQEILENRKSDLKRLKQKETDVSKGYMSDGYNQFLALEHIEPSITRTIYQLLKSNLETQIADLEKQLEELW